MLSDDRTFCVCDKETFYVYQKSCARRERVQAWLSA